MNKKTMAGMFKNKNHLPTSMKSIDEMLYMFVKIVVRSSSMLFFVMSSNNLSISLFIPILFVINYL